MQLCKSAGGKGACTPVYLPCREPTPRPLQEQPPLRGFQPAAVLVFHLSAESTKQTACFADVIQGHFQKGKALINPILFPSGHGANPVMNMLT